MARGIIQREDLPFIETISALANCNPFLEERITLEKQALGPSFVDTGPAWNLSPAYFTEDPNIHTMLKWAAEAAERSRQNLLKRQPASDRERQIYTGLVYFIVYHRYVEDFDKNINRAHEIGNALERVAFYDRFQRDLDHYFRPGGDRSIEVPLGYGHMLAIGYQIRRAFVHIFNFFIGTSRAAAALRAHIWQSIFTHDMARYQRSLYNRMGDVITLITGPSGSGKELVARAIGLSRFIPFDTGARQFAADFIGSFHPINLSALSPTLIESELFGHRKGAFTGALQDRKGYFEICGPDGTVFLDEVGETDTGIQVKLLRVLQTRQFQRLGDTRLRDFPGKVMAATNRDLPAEIREGRFREDFYYRLCADRIETPTLRDMLAGSDKELRHLVRFVAAKVAGEGEADALTAESCEWVVGELGLDYAWPGNFRELEQCVRNIMVHREYYPGELSPDVSTPDSLAARVRSGSLTAEEMMKEYVTRVYAKLRNYEAAARRLDVDRRTIKKYVDEDLLDKLSQ